MKRIIICMAVFLYLFNTNTFAQKYSTIQRVKRFELFSNCEPISILVEGLSREALNIGLTKESVQNAVESRLRSARIYSSNPTLHSSLYISVNVSNRSFSIALEFNKRVFDLFTKTYGTAITWSDGGIGTHGNRVGGILSSLSQLMDDFLVDFLRINDEACRKKK